MDPRSPVYQFFSLSTRSDLKKYLCRPLIISVVLSVIFSYGHLDNVIRYLIDIVPVISSILLGFLGMIMVASLSNNSIFDRMRADAVELKEGLSISVYRIFFIGLFFDMICFVVLLATSILIGSLNQSFDFDYWFYFVEVMIILFLLLSSSMLFIRNMDRVYQITIHMN